MPPGGGGRGWASGISQHWAAGQEDARITSPAHPAGKVETLVCGKQLAIESCKAQLPTCPENVGALQVVLRLMI